MSTTPLTPGEGVATAQPLVVVVSSVPLIFEALRETIRVFAEVRSLTSWNGTAELLRSIRPAAVVVDNEEDAADAETVAREIGFSVVHLSLAERSMRLFSGGRWTVADSGAELRPETVRDLIAADLFAKGTA